MITSRAIVIVLAEVPAGGRSNSRRIFSVPIEPLAQRTVNAPLRIRAQMRGTHREPKLAWCGASCRGDAAICSHPYRRPALLGTQDRRALARSG